ncbi:MAG: hypothetical protein JNK58_03530 [Phycisphaerae bacterium]|nr:hypothetical protein [Phycisphaerae bacterium]
MSTMRFVKGVAACAVLASAAGADAAMITFVHEGMGGGVVGNTVFGATAPVPFVITAVGDTDNLDTSLGFARFINHDSAVIDIFGVGTFTFTSPTRTFVNVNGIVGFSRAGASGLDLFNGPQTAELGAWDMLSSIGPVSGDGALSQWGALPIIETDAGVIEFFGASSPATFTAFVVPTPAGLALCGIGALVAARRRR